MNKPHHSNRQSVAKLPIQLATFLLLAAVIGLPGCTNNSVSEIEDLETVSLYSQTDQLAQTMEYIRSVERYRTDNFRDKVNSGLNRWTAGLEEEVAADWALPSLTDTLPEPIKTEPVFTHIDDENFYYNDADFLQQSFWFHEIANRIANSNFTEHQEYIFQAGRNLANQDTLSEWEESEDLLADALTLIHPELVGADDDDRIQKLAQTIRLFDWTVRNVQLVETLPWPDKEIAEKTSIVPDANLTDWPAASGTAGPGYVRFPWQTFTYAKGDFLERARVFSGLCHQIDVPVAVLAFPNNDEVADENLKRPYDEWICAALIDGQMYLFDTYLGLPIPGEKPAQVATLSYLKQNRELLRDLDLTVEESVEKTNYPVQAEQLDNLIALVVAAPESVSKRMAGVQKKLTGNNKLKLTIDVDKLATDFSAIEGIGKSVLWHAPYSNHIFRDRYNSALITASYDQNIRQRTLWLARQEAYVDSFVMLRTARNCLLRGIFVNDRERDIRSAMSYYYSFMYSDNEIAEIDQDVLLQQRLGILKGENQSFDNWAIELSNMKASMKLVRADAAFFLAHSNYENGKPSTSLKWLKRLPSFEDPKNERWIEYLPYAIGRAHESIGEYEEAAMSYGKDKSPQRHGSILRQRQINRLIDKPEASNP